MGRVILYAHRLDASTGSGVQRYTDGLIGGMEEIASADWEVTAVSPDRAPQRRPGGPVTYGTVPVPRKVIHGLWMVAEFPPLEAFTGATDLVHLLSTAIPVPSRAPQVVTVHDLFTVRHPEWFEPRSVRATLKTLHRAVRSARRIIAPSAFVAEDITRTLQVDPDRISIVHEGVTSRFAADESDGDAAGVLTRYSLGPRPYLITVGLLSPRKNLRVLAEAWAILRSRLGDDTPALVVVGPNDVGHEAARRDVDRLGLSGTIRFTGYVPDADLRALLGGATALVHPSLDEGFGLTPLEAMAAGVPALVSSSGAIPEVTGDAAQLLDPRDPAAWADAVETIVSNRGLRESMIEAGRRRAALFTWSAAARGTLAVYRAALSGA
ncbi:MAG TPA: glycosyltransferase family 1 protein [Candidatus Dormibacteraeota bacterium]